MPEKLFVLLLALLVTGDDLVRSVYGIQFVAIWNLLPQLNLYSLDISSQLIVGSNMVTLACTVSLAALVRGIFAWRGVSASAPK